MNIEKLINLNDFEDGDILLITGGNENEAIELGKEIRRLVTKSKKIMIITSRDDFDITLERIEPSYLENLGYTYNG